MVSSRISTLMFVISLNSHFIPRAFHTLVFAYPSQSSWHRMLLANIVVPGRCSDGTILLLFDSQHSPHPQ